MAYKCSEPGDCVDSLPCLIPSTFKQGLEKPIPTLCHQSDISLLSNGREVSLPRPVSGYASRLNKR